MEPLDLSLIQAVLTKHLAAWVQSVQPIAPLPPLPHGRRYPTLTLRYHLPIGTQVCRAALTAQQLLDPAKSSLWGAPLLTTKAVTYDEADIVSTIADDPNAKNYYLIALPPEAKPYSFLLVETKLVSLLRA